MLLAFALLLSLLPAMLPTARAASASGKLGDNLSWSLNTSGVLTISGSGQMITWNNSISQPWYDYREDIKSVVIKEGVTSISAYAFHQCTNLTTVSIPASVNYYMSDPFGYCDSLTKFTVASGNTILSTDSYGVLYNKDKTTIHTYTTGRTGAFTVPSTVTYLNNDSFSHSAGLTAITFPDTLRGLGNSALAYCTSLTSVTLPDSVISIGGYILQGCTSLTSVRLSDGITSFPYGILTGCKSLTEVHLPANLWQINSSTFAGCSSLTSIDIPDSVTTIGNQAFSGCTKLTDITLPATVKTLGTYVFYYCKSLTQINIPAGVTAIPDNAFYCCDALTDVYYEGTTSQWSAVTIGTNTGMTAATLHCSDDAAQAQAAADLIAALPAAQQLTRDDAAQVAAARAAYDALTDTQKALVENLSVLTAAEERIAFLENHECAYETAITAPTCENGGYTTYTCTDDETAALDHAWDDGVITTQPALGTDGVRTFTCTDCGDTYTESIPVGTCGENLFWYLDNGVLTIGGTGAMTGYDTDNHAPWYDAKDTITSVVIEPGVTSVGSFAFYYCRNMTQATLPEGVTIIERYAFYDCDKLTQITLPDTLQVLESYAFGRCLTLPQINLPDSLTSIGAFALYFCQDLKEIVIPEGITLIDNGMFSGCFDLTSVTIPTTVTTINKAAFYNCTNLTDVYYNSAEADWNKITVGELNDLLLTANFHFPHSHTYEAAITAPTCENGGYTTYTCACGDSYTDDETSALGHDEIDHAAKAPTCTEPGWNAYVTCSRCNYSTYQEIGANGHHHEAAITDPTCEDGGYTTYTCACGDSYTGDETGALGHAWDNGVVTTKPTATKEGIRTYTCTCSGCGKTRTEPVPATGSTAVNPFVDVKKGAFYYDPVLWAVENGITTGTSATTFSPDNTCTRAQVVTFLWRAAGSPTPTTKTCSFTDVTQGYYYNAMLWAVENGITTGTGGNKFSPNANCTRAQVVTFLWRAAGEPAPSSTACAFTDVSRDFYYNAMLWAVENGITTGTGSGKFSPNLSCTRGQIVTFLYRAYN